ncbi:MAG: DUF2064 domain-containing protein [Verrucomicrobia bacterium]|nr:DUF2064 domain-containing protein [Verrucomicrobiota bacterium]
MEQPPVTASTPACREALLVFVNALALDLHQRRLPGSAAPLLEVETLVRAAAAPGRDVHWFEHGPIARRGSQRQVGTDFGQRLQHAVESLRAAGYARIVIIGRDCPTLQAADLEEAFTRLRSGDAAVLGPASDGGCYLIGLQAAHTDALRDIPWCRGRDAARLRTRFADLPSSELPEQADLDSILDLRRLATSLAVAAELARRVLALVAAGVRRLHEQAVFALAEPFAAARERLQRPPPLAA